MKNWKTTAGALVALAIVALDMFGVAVPGVSAHSLDMGAIVALVIGLIQAKDKDVTGAGDAARRIE
jgi:hypothetical protein